MITRFQNAVALVTVLTIVNPVIADGFKTWKSQNQKYSVKAKFENYDTDSKQVTLIDRDENTITVQLDQLSSSDQKYVLRRYKRLVAEKNAANPFKLTKNKPEKEQARTDQDEVPTIARWGIEWTPSMEASQRVALGSRRRSNDDRPIMWFRVLGNLEGYM